MGDGGLDFRFDDYEDVFEVEFSASRAATRASAAEARKTLMAALTKMPDAKLVGMKNFRIVVARSK